MSVGASCIRVLGTSKPFWEVRKRRGTVRLAVPHRTALGTQGMIVVPGSRSHRSSAYGYWGAKSQWQTWQDYDRLPTFSEYRPWTRRSQGSSSTSHSSRPVSLHLCDLHCVLPVFPRNLSMDPTENSQTFNVPDNTQSQRPARGLEAAQVPVAEVGDAEATVPTSGEVSVGEMPSSPQSAEAASSPPAALGSNAGGASTEASRNQASEVALPEPSLQQELNRKIVDLVFFLLLKYRRGQVTSRAEILHAVIREYEAYYSAIFSKAIDCMRLMFGLDIIERNPLVHSYSLVHALGITYDGLQHGFPGIPKTGLLIIMLCIIFIEDNCVSEEALWRILNGLGLYAGRDHFIYGEPRRLITEHFVQERYLECRQSKILLMSSQNVGMDSATKMVLPVGQRPGRENQSNSSESQVYNRENLLRQGDRVGIQDEAVQGGQLTANEEGNTNLFQQPFPRKLWTIVQNETFQCLNWSEDRDSITIKVDMFQREVLHRRATGKIFETKILQSFIRQLYRYGFRKIRPKDSSLLSRVSRKMMVYRTFNFQRDKPELLKIIRRKKWVSKATSPVPSAVEQGQDPKKVKLLPPGLYQWFQKREHDGMKSQQRGPNNQTPAGNLSTRLSSTYNQSNIPESVPDNCPPQQTSVPCGEGTSDNATVPPLATGHVPSSSSRYLRALASTPLGPPCPFMDSSSIFMPSVTWALKGVETELLSSPHIILVSGSRRLLSPGSALPTEVTRKFLSRSVRACQVPLGRQLEAELSLGLRVLDPAAELLMASRLLASSKQAGSKAAKTSRNQKHPLAYLGRQMEAELPLGAWCSEPASAELGPARRMLASDDSEQ
ncbi:hypothetical protein NN561_011040 [Cricetulus griseus]